MTEGATRHNSLSASLRVRQSKEGGVTNELTGGNPREPERKPPMGSITT